MKIHREGTNILVILLAMFAMLNAVAWLFLSPMVIPAVLTGISVMVYAFVFNFFRCPNAIIGENARIWQSAPWTVRWWL